MSDIGDSSSNTTSDYEYSEDDLINSTSDEESLVERERPKNQNFFEIIVPQFNDKEFMEHFRVSRGVSEIIAERFENSEYFNYQSGGNGKQSSYQQVIIYLWFVGHQTSSFRDVADRFNIAISTLFTSVRKITYFFSNLSPEIVRWPSNEEKIESERYFRRNGFPGAIGAIDGSHVKIDKPTNDPDSYLNRKHFFSLQVL